ncbi:hypothetical protein SAMN05216374_5741 [Tardiphaga sp. OK246]|jgi:hypothetical protein|nr:hypothetical protein SAMN05216374_5741 [Tardiphaga sp. OK246]
MSVVKNETIKLIANWCNAASVTLGGTGVVVPILSRYFHFGPQAQNADGLWGLILLCGALCVGLHLLGQLVLGGLDEQP